MTTAILGWGSLIWDPRELRVDGEWVPDGPELPIEFSRVSRDKRLTLVIDEQHGAWCRVYSVKSACANVDDAREDLRIREDATRISTIGYIDRSTGRHHGRSGEIVARIGQWAQISRIDSVVWTDLGSNFQRVRGDSFTIEGAVQYIQGLDEATWRLAMEYIKRAPVESDTPFRRSFSTPS